jgi:hypothetical protein
MSFSVNNTWKKRIYMLSLMQVHANSKFPELRLQDFWLGKDV